MKLKKKRTKLSLFYCTANEPQVAPLCDISLHHQHPELTADFDRDSCKERMKMFVRTFSGIPSIKINHNAVSDLVDLSLDQSPGSEKHTLSENNSSSGSVTPQDKTQTEKVAISNNSRKRKPPSPFSPEEVVGKRRPKLRPTDPRIPNSKQSKLFRENTPLKKNTTQHKGKVLSQPKSNKQSTQVEPSSSVNTQLVALMDQVGKLSSELAEMKTNQTCASFICNCSCSNCCWESPNPTFNCPCRHSIWKSTNPAKSPNFYDSPTNASSTIASSTNTCQRI